MQNKTVRSYWDTEDFGKSYQHGKQKHREYLLDLLKEKGVYSLLDSGCGTGPIYELITKEMIPTAEMATEVQRWRFKYKGTDYSWRMIDTARKSFPEGKFEVQDARKMTEEDGSWDCVLLMHCLDHLNDYKAAIKEAARVSKKYVCIVLWRGFVNEGTHLNDRNMMGKKEGEAPFEDTYLQEYSKESLDEAFKEAGLAVEEVAEGEKINGDASKYNFLYFLKKV